MSDQTIAKFRAGLVQLCAGRDIGKNISDACALIREAASRGAKYIQTPECTTLMELDRNRLLSVTEPEDKNRALQSFSDLARDLNIWLHIGSMGVRLPNQKIANRSFLIMPNGQIAATYDKIHMFDVDLGGENVYRESDSYAAGDRAALVDLPWGPLGMTICYDLRFPALHRALAKAGAQFIAIPAAFTRITGEAHWHTLLKARAIETQCFVFAAGQGGRHENGRETFGHSLIIGPWGDVLGEAGTEPTIVIADIDANLLIEARRKVPSLLHDRAFEVVYSRIPKIS